MRKLDEKKVPIEIGECPGADRSMLPDENLDMSDGASLEGSQRAGVMSVLPHTTARGGKFSDPDWTVQGEPRARVKMVSLQTLWFNTGTLCNITCKGCYIESSPRNDRLAYLERAEVRNFLDEAIRSCPDLREIGFTGGEPFMNPDIVGMTEDALSAGYRALILTNAMKPIRRHYTSLLHLRARFGNRLTIRVSLDHHTRPGHEEIRGPNSWAATIAGLKWLGSNGFDVAVAARTAQAEDELSMRRGFAALFAGEGVDIDATDPHRLVIFPEMDETADVPEITEQCWEILGKRPADVMCSNSRMVVKRKGATDPVVISCTLLPYDERFELGRSLRTASGTISLNHAHCAKFCVLGGARCSA